MEHLGPFSTETLRQHLIQVRKLGGNGIPANFRLEQTSVYVYLQETTITTTTMTGPTVSNAAGTTRTTNIALWQRILCSGLHKRISVADAMKHDFIVNNKTTTT